jgi:CopG family transcriptional regulator / antitoxin EndoAI
MKRSVIASFSLSSETLKQAGELAKAENKSRSEVVNEAVGKYYAMKQWETLQEYGAKQAQRLGIKNESDVERLVHDYRRKKS